MGAKGIFLNCKTQLRNKRRLHHVRFTPESRHVHCTSACLLWANSGHIAFHSITSSARPSRESGVLRPRALADLRLIIISSFVAWKTGRLAGFSPLRIWPV